MPRYVMLGIAGVVCLVWAANMVYAFIDPSRADPGINAIFASVVGVTAALFKPPKQEPKP